jgi:hypothetical protein
MINVRMKPIAVCMAIGLALGLPAAAAKSPTAAASVSGHGVEIRASHDAPAYLLRVSSPDGHVYEDYFLPGEAMLVRPASFGLPKWRDGGYQYEVVPVLGERVRGEAQAGALPKAAVATAATSRGSFQVLGGVVHVSGAQREAGGGHQLLAVPTAPIVAPMDVVNADDVIVQGSLCVGFDCVDNESFGFDTVRLKENNTRIKFDDTSASAGFPANDWQLTANDSASGGANKFSIEDITGARVPVTVLAGAPTDSLFIASTGKLGFRTSVPVLDLHMSTTDTPAIRFEQTNAGGFTAQTWDVAGNEANFFVRDVTGGSRLPFRIRPGAPTSSIDIAATGDVGVGTASPATALHVARTTGAVTLRLARTGAVAASWDVTNNSATGRLTFTDDATGVRVPVKFGVNAVDNLLRVGILNTSTVDVNGNLKVTGNIQVTGTVGPDYVFAPEFQLPSIEDHAESMWSNRHLPKVGPAVVNDQGQGVIDLGALSHGMLEELEYAHVYIAELNSTVGQLEAQLAAKDEVVQQMREEIDAIKRQIAVD